MRQDIKAEMKEIEIWGKKTRRKVLRNIFVVVILVTVVFAVTYSYAQFGILLGVELPLVFVCGIYVLGQISKIYQPLEPEDQAFKNVAEAIETLEQSSKEQAYEEAYHNLKTAHKILEGIQLDELDWYKSVNETIEQFNENLELRVLPAIRKSTKSTIEIQDLEKIALALCSTDTLRMKETNKILESKYESGEPLPTKTETYLRRIKQHTLGRFLIPLVFGYVLILMICGIYTFATQQDFIVFARANPSIIILGGLGVSGITFWKTK